MSDLPRGVALSRPTDQAAARLRAVVDGYGVDDTLPKTLPATFTRAPT